MQKVLIADDHPLFRAALREVVETKFTDYEILEAGTLAEAQDCLSESEMVDVDLILLDLQMPGCSGFSGLVKLRNAAPSVPIVIVSATASNDVIREAIVYGASGFIPKSFSKDEMARAMKRILSGDLFLPSYASQPDETKPPMLAADAQDRLATLTPGEMRVLELLAKGQPNKIIAFELGIRESTVKAHITAILRKLRVHSRTQAVLAAQNVDFKRL
ncbi:MAG: response regulator transcription factor [Hyphomicrobiales bacterium]|nr:response regulator transcription factor [Hyphomicrobiales bacterium]